MATKSSAVANAKKIASKLKTAKKSKSVKRYEAQGQNPPQSKAWTEPNDEGVKAKPIGYRWTTLGAEKLGKRATTSPSKADVENYRGKTFRAKGETHRYIYIERRVDKSDKSVKAKFKEGGSVKQAKPQSQVYKTSRDKKVEAKPVGYRYKGNNYNEPSQNVIKREMKKPREDRKIYYEVRKDKSDYDFYSKFKRGGVNQVGRQYPNYSEDMDGQKLAKPVGYRYTDRLAKRLGVKPYARPTEAHIEKYLGRGIYMEKREDKTDVKPSERYISLAKGGTTKELVLLVDSHHGVYVPKVFLRNYDLKTFGFNDKDIAYFTKAFSDPSSDDYFDAYEEMESKAITKDGSTITTADGNLWLVPKGYTYDDFFYAEGGMMARGGMNQVGRQYPNYSEDMDGQKLAKPVGYRYTDRLAKRLGVKPYARPTEAHIEKYLGRGIYMERREDKTDMKPSERYISLADGGMMARGGVERIANRDAREYTENMIPFTANNLDAKTLSNGDYVVLSYGYYPIWYYCKAENQWYGNSTKYSVTTSKQMSQSRPSYDAKMLTRNELEQAMMKNSAKFENGGMLDGILGSEGNLQSVGGTTFSSTDLTSHMDMNNPNF
jgi:hypothetical protein